jgi:NAD(P)-dependent dehydrogenase (short-subunit alcohol dehydrogenase family)
MSRSQLPLQRQYVCLNSFASWAEYNLQNSRATHNREDKMAQLDGRVALITGAASGMGQAAALLLAKEGAKIGVLDLSPEDVQKTVDKINNSGGQAIPLIADVSQPDQMQQAATQLADKWGRIDIVFANAGVNGVWAPLDELEPDEWDRTLAINLKARFSASSMRCPT